MGGSAANMLLNIINTETEVKGPGKNQTTESKCECPTMGKKKKKDFTACSN